MIRKTRKDKGKKRTGVARKVGAAAGVAGLGALGIAAAAKAKKFRNSQAGQMAADRLGKSLGRVKGAVGGASSAVQGGVASAGRFAKTKTSQFKNRGMKRLSPGS